MRNKGGGWRCILKEERSGGQFKDVSNGNFNDSNFKLTLEQVCLK